METETMTAEAVRRQRAAKLYTIVESDFGSFPDCRKLWKSREGALAWLKGYCQWSDEAFDDWLARTNGKQGYYRLSVVPVEDCENADDLPDELYVMVGWIWDEYRAAQSARTVKDDVHTGLWKVLP